MTGVFRNNLNSSFEDGNLMIVTGLHGTTEKALKYAVSENLSSSGSWLAPSLS